MNGHVYFNVVKNEGGKDPIAQNNLYFLHSHREDEGLDPMLLLSMVGSHYCQVFGAVFGYDNQLLVDPLCDSISFVDRKDYVCSINCKMAVTEVCGGIEFCNGECFFLLSNFVGDI